MSLPPLVLLVCNSALLNSLLLDLLQRMGAQARSVSGTHDALALMPQPALVLVELLLADEVGFGIVRRLRAGYEGPLLLLSGTGRDSDLAWGQGAGADAVLRYPVAPEHLLPWLPGLPEPV